MGLSENRDYSCPICGARNLQVTSFSPPILYTHEKQPGDDWVYVVGTYYCTVCSKDGIVTTKERASNGDKT